MNLQPASRLLVERQDKVLILTFNRPESLNGFSLPLMEDLDDALRDAKNDDSIGAIVIRGAGRAFSAGMDVKEAPEIRKKAEAHLFNVTRKLREMNKIVVAAVHGHCYLGAFILTASCDLVVMSESANIVARAGVGSDWLPFAAARFGPGVIRRLQLTEEPISGKEAYALGVAQWLVPDDQLQTWTLDLAQRVAKKPTSDIAAVKERLNI